MELVIHSKSLTTNFALSSGVDWKIGRHPDNDITIDDPKASRHHGLLSSHDGAFFFEDLGTGNGTMISSVLVPPKTRIEIKEGDVIEIGEVQLRLVASDSVAESPPEALPKGKMPVLTDLAGKSKDSVFVLSDEPTLIGRLPICQIKIDDPGSSRINCEVVLEEDSKFYVRDLGSSNGTFLNEKGIKKEVLRPGDVVRVGSHRFEFTYANLNELPLGEATHPGAPDNGKSNLTSGCSTVSFGLIMAIVSGAAVFLYMAKVRGPVAEVSDGASPAASPSKVDIEAPVVVGNPLVIDIPVTLQKTGNVLLARQDIIPFPPGRKVEKVHVTNRERVEKGDALVTFEMTEELRSARKQAIAALNQATEDVAKTESEVAKADAVLENSRQNLSIIKNTHDRSLPLYRNRNLLQKEWDEILVNLAEAEAAVKLRIEEKEQAERSVVQSNERVVQVQTDLSDVDVMIEDLTITANSAGVVNRLDLKEGYTVTSINSSMELIEYEKEVKVIVSVSEDDIILIRDGMEVDVWLSRAQEQVFRGRVAYIPPTAANRNYDIEIMVPNRDYHFRPGQQVSVRFITETREGAVLLPPSALDTNSRTGYHIFTVDPVSWIANLVPVKRGQEVTHQNESFIEILPVEGEKTISGKDLIIIKGNKAVKHQMKVVIRNLDESTGLPK